ncbi:glycerophosphodiester phosphodiesterase [bacterium]|nr:glycerophosphodiester phosphodiesterase [bacterium]MBU1064133.1 glycerophosphodiester phosphodiesterase [bacterium]MBU1634887.1 glycerophosphodiester phosphodiesterase [bacterium]MBU1872670.1 glycerophosphodiester phosphodiesterase [bacterium]
MIVFGHQGAPGYAPENTLLSFNEAIRRGTDWIELDVHLVGNELLVIHDYRLDRTTDGQGIIYKQSIDYIRSLDAGQGEKVPFLHEVFDTVDRRVGINIELKSADTAEPVMELVDHYIQNHGWSINDFMISSFNHFELKTVRKINPDIKIGILLYGVPLDFEQIKHIIKPYSINISIDFISRSIVDIIHEKELNVFIFTVNFEDEIQWMLDLGVDGVFTDYPDRVKAILSK